MSTYEHLPSNDKALLGNAHLQLAAHRGYRREHDRMESSITAEELRQARRGARTESDIQMRKITIGAGAVLAAVGLVLAIGMSQGEDTPAPLLPETSPSAELNPTPSSPTPSVHPWIGGKGGGLQVSAG